MHLLQHKNPFVRQAVRGALHIPRWMHFYALTGSPIIANSFPKSGTHLLDQIVATLPGVARYGRFLSSMTSSFRFRERSHRETLAFIESLAPSELLRAHMFFDKQYAEALQELKTTHYFIYRDPRDVVVSEAFYLRDMNRWHKLHRYFKNKSDQAILLMAINGIQDDELGDSFPHIGERFSKYAGWIKEANTFAVRFGELRGEGRAEIVRRMVTFHAERHNCEYDIDLVTSQAVAAIQPRQSHTFRKGSSGGWNGVFDQRCRDAFKTVAGKLLIEFGFAEDLDW